MLSPKFHLARQVTSRHDSTRSTCRARRDERVESCCSDKLDTAKMHGLDTSNVSCRVETWRDEPSGQVEFGLYRTSIITVCWADFQHHSCLCLLSTKNHSSDTKKSIFTNQIITDATSGHHRHQIGYFKVILHKQAWGFTRLWVSILFA